MLYQTKTCFKVQYVIRISKVGNITEFKCTCHFFCYNPWINAALLSLVAAFYSIATFMDDFLLFVVFTQESGILLGIYGYSNHKFKS